MLKTIVLLFGILIAFIGVIMIFDARLLTRKLFSFGDQNEATLGFKILGFILAIIGALIVYFNIA